MWGWSRWNAYASVAANAESRQAWSERRRRTLRVPESSMGRPRRSWFGLRVVLRPRGEPGGTVSLLADKLCGALKVFETVSVSTVQRGFKNEVKPWQVKRFCIPPRKPSAARFSVNPIPRRPSDPPKGRLREGREHGRDRLTHPNHASSHHLAVEHAATGQHVAAVGDGQVRGRPVAIRKGMSSSEASWSTGFVASRTARR